MSFMTKNPRTRLDETVAYIASRVPAPEQLAVRTFLNDTIAFYGTGKSFKDYSNSMTMTDVKNPGNEGERERRRALMMLEGMKTSATDARVLAIKTQPVGTVDTHLAALIDKVRIAADETKGSGGLLQSVFLNSLMSKTRMFLKHHRLPEGGIGSRTVAYLYYEYKKDQYKIETTKPGIYPKAYQFNAVSIPPVAWFDVPGRTNSQTAGSFAGIVGTELTGANAMITTQFSGCCFCFKVVGARIFAVHIMPDAGSGGNAINGGGTGLARQLAGQVPGITGGNFAAPCPGGGQFFVYGAGYSNVPGFPGGYPPRQTSEYMNIFGRKRDDAWKIYTQHVHDNTNHYKVHRVYPSHH
jgi:hypothetical protein